jgi:hypothetical protein
VVAIWRGGWGGGVVFAVTDSPSRASWRRWGRGAGRRERTIRPSFTSWRLQATGEGRTRSNGRRGRCEVEESRQEVKRAREGEKRERVHASSRSAKWTGGPGLRGWNGRWRPVPVAPVEPRRTQRRISRPMRFLLLHGFPPHAKHRPFTASARCQSLFFGQLTSVQTNVL